MPDFVSDFFRRMKLAVFDFDGVFTDNFVYVDQDGRETVRCSRADGLGLEALAKIGVEALVVSTEKNPVVSARCKKLGVPCVQGVPDKCAALARILAEKGLDWSEVSFMGNDVNDAGCLEKAGLPIVVHDAHQDVIPLAKLRTRAPGGHGAVREICDAIAAARKGMHARSSV